MCLAASPKPKGSNHGPVWARWQNYDYKTPHRHKKMHPHTQSLNRPLGITMLMEDGHAASMKSRSRGLSRCRTGCSCLMEEIHMDMGRSSACFFTLKPNIAVRCTVTGTGELPIHTEEK